MFAVMATASLVPIFFGIIFIFQAGARKESGRAPMFVCGVILFAFSLLIAALAGYFSGYEDAAEYYEQILKGKPKPPPPLLPYRQTA